MPIVDLAHRWAGGVLGLLLVVIGASGTLLIHADAIFRPASRPVASAAPLASMVAKAAGEPDRHIDYILFASNTFPFHRIAYSDGSGRYLDMGGAEVAQWQSQWERPELWIFDLHRHLFLGNTGETIGGFVALVGIGFVLSGVLLWWQRRKSFAPRIFPARLTRPAVLRHHRDLGILLAPLLLLSFVTGASMALKPVGLALVSPWSSAAEIRAANAVPEAESPSLTPTTQNWTALLSDAHRRFPRAEIRLLGFPKTPGSPILLRLKQPEEWLPNGHTNLWFRPDGHLIEARDARDLPEGAKLLDTLYPLHAAKVGGLPHRLLMTIPGLGLMLLGSLAVWSFWFRRSARPTAS